MARTESIFRTPSFIDMRMSLLFFILLHFPQSSATTPPNLTAGCWTGDSHECRKALFVPGHTLLGEGFDIVTMKPTGSFLLDMQVVDENCTLCNNPYNNNVPQKLPKVMVDWRPQPTCSREIVSSFYQSTISLTKEAISTVKNDWKTQLDVDIHEKDSGFALKTSVGGTRSDLVNFAESKSSSDMYNFISQKLKCSYYSFGTSMTPPLTAHFTQSMMKLPTAYDSSSRAEYRRLINRFGTHYITWAEVGGRAQEVTAVRTCEVAMDGMTVDEVMDCLGLEAKVSAKIEIVSFELKALHANCNERAKHANRGSSYHQSFRERWWQVTGGEATSNLLSDEKDSEMFNIWMKSLKTYPGLVSYTLDPIHNLVRFEGPQKENLRLAISDYIKEKALKMNCSCSGNSFPSHREDCSCVCPPSKHINVGCCPTHRGQAKLHVTIKQAQGLKGDRLTKTDAYVKMKFGFDEVIAPTIWNNNNPRWNETFDLGIVDLVNDKKITIEVYDEDNKYDDDFLGKCEESVTSGDVLRTCYLNYGSLTYFISITCLPYLQGRYCHDYSSPPYIRTDSEFESSGKQVEV